MKQPSHATHSTHLYVPEAYQAADAARIVREYPFATLITTSAAGIHATSTPLFFGAGGDQSMLVGHLFVQGGGAGTHDDPS